MAIWGVDLGGTKIEGVVLANHSPDSVVARLRVPTEAAQGYEHILSQINKLITVLKAESGLVPTAIGFGTPGTLDPGTQTMKNSNTTALNGKNLKADLEALLGVRCEFANDANCFALAEATMGAVPEAVPNAQVCFGIIMGTGVGGGLVVNGKVINGRHGIGGEWGHNFLDASGGPCYCGLSGCVETVIAGPSLTRWYQEQGGKLTLLADILSSENLAIDPVAQALKGRLITMFGKAVASLVNCIDPDAIVLGGGVGNVDFLYTEGVAEVAKYIFNLKLETAFLRPKLGDSAGVFGAAMLVA